jgi:hypothetical protein
MLSLRVGPVLATALLCACADDAGVLGGACYGNGTCNTGLECRSQVCVEELTGDQPDGGSVTPDGGEFARDVGTETDGGTLPLDSGTGDLDAGFTDSGEPVDTGISDAGLSDSASSDASGRDALPADSGSDGGSTDASIPDAGSDPCAGITCALAPPPQCVSPATLRIYSAPGQCANGICGAYPFTDSPCVDQCIDGACVDTTCGQDTCDMPPPPECTTSSNLRIFSPVGSCEPTGCEYTPIDSVCTDGCVSGLCAPGSWLDTTIEAQPSFTTIALDSNDVPHIAHESNNNVFLSWLSSTGWQMETIALGTGMNRPVVKIDSGDNVHLAYTDSYNGNVLYAHRPAGSASFSSEFVETIGAPAVLDMKVDDQGLPQIFYRDYSAQRLRVAQRDPVLGWAVTHEIGTTDRPAYRGAMVLDASGAPVIAWAEEMGTSPYSALRSMIGVPASGTWTAHQLPDVAYITGLAIEQGSGELHIGQVFDSNQTLQIVHGIPPGPWTDDLIGFDAGNSLGGGDMAIDDNGVLHVVFYEDYSSARELRHLWFTGPGTFQQESPRAGIHGSHSISFAFDAQQRPHISVERFNRIHYIRPY